MYEYLHSKKPKSETYDKIIKLLGDISLSNEKLRPFVLDPENVMGHRNLRLMAVELENIINIKNYRTPNSLRAYTKVFLNIFPVIFGPFSFHFFGSTLCANFLVLYESGIVPLFLIM